MAKHSYLNSMAHRARMDVPVLTPPRVLPAFGEMDRDVGTPTRASSRFEASNSIHSVEVRPKMDVASQPSPAKTIAKSEITSVQAKPTPSAPNQLVAQTDASNPSERSAGQSVHREAPNSSTLSIAHSTTQQGRDKPTAATSTDAQRSVSPTPTVDDALRAAFQWVSSPTPEPRKARAAPQADLDSTPHLDHVPSPQVRSREPLPQALPPGRDSKPLPPRTIHIGKIEVNVAPPSPPVTSAPTNPRNERDSKENRGTGATESILRGLVSPLGLRQI